MAGFRGSRDCGEDGGEEGEWNGDVERREVRNWRGVGKGGGVGIEDGLNVSQRAGNTVGSQSSNT